jgi:hypothetical protein
MPKVADESIPSMPTCSGSMPPCMPWRTSDSAIPAPPATPSPPRMPTPGGDARAPDLDRWLISGMPVAGSITSSSAPSSIKSLVGGESRGRLPRSRLDRTTTRSADGRALHSRAVTLLPRCAAASKLAPERDDPGQLLSAAARSRLAKKAGSTSSPRTTRWPYVPTSRSRSRLYRGFETLKPISTCPW